MAISPRRVFSCGSTRRIKQTRLRQQNKRPVWMLSSTHCPFRRSNLFKGSPQMQCRGACTLGCFPGNGAAQRVIKLAEQVLWRSTSGWRSPYSKVRGFRPSSRAACCRRRAQRRGSPACSIYCQTFMRKNMRSSLWAGSSLHWTAAIRDDNTCLQDLVARPRELTSRAGL